MKKVTITDSDGILIASYSIHENEFLDVDRFIDQYNCDKYCLHESHKETA
jgi:hypothetical protein